MAKKEGKKQKNVLVEVRKKAAAIDTSGLKQKAADAAELISDKAIEIKDAALDAKDDIAEKLNELDRMLAESVTEYNDTYTLMNDKGVQLFVERTRAVDLIENVEVLVNSIANHPKEFDADFEEINVRRQNFIGVCEYADKELQAARKAAGSAGAGLAAGASVAFMAPTAAMWIATTFGTASTGAAISTLTGAAATNAALAWLGGGALAAGGGGMAAGNALLALAGPVGWTIAGATLLSSILIFTSKKAKLNKQKNEEIAAVKNNTERIKEVDIKIAELLDETKGIISGLRQSYSGALASYAKDYKSMTEEQKIELGSLVNNTKSLSVLLDKTIE